MRAVIFVNGLVDDYGRLAAWLRADDYLIGADGGTMHCLALGRRPDVVVGDLDSLSGGVVAELRAAGVEIEEHPVAKDSTDLDLAIDRAIRDGADAVLLVGALGGRLDQTLSNLLLLARREWPVPLSLAEGDELAQVVRGGETITVGGEPGSTVSAVPLSEVVTGVTYTGLAYPLADATLPLGSTRGISNELAGREAQISVGAGMLLVISMGCGGRGANCEGRVLTTCPTRKPLIVAGSARKPSLDVASWPERLLFLGLLLYSVYDGLTNAEAFCAQLFQILAN